jgi:aminoglycoside/choline kinase family phosphotransferase
MAATPESTEPRNDTRLRAARDWLRERAGTAGSGWRPVAGDASFRRYFRVTVGGRSRILMDSPPELENPAPFVEIAGRLSVAGLHAPEVVLADLETGFLLLEDLGDQLYRDLLGVDTVEPLFAEAFTALATMANQVSCSGLPAYDASLFSRELGWFTEYYLHQHRGHRWNSGQAALWSAFCQQLVESAQQQPQVFVHKDVHSCNLLRTGHNSPGIIDFQDAVRGPLTYDFVSLIWDRYIAWPRDRIESWMEQFRQLAAPGLAASDWVRWCDFMGLQRNIKIVGRFALLRHAQGKHGYVEMIPRFYSYLLDVLPRYPEFSDIAALLKDPACAP